MEIFDNWTDHWFIKLFFGTITGWWARMNPLVQMLILLMVVDTVAGYTRAAMSGTLSSSTAFKGVCKKVLTLSVVIAAVIVQPNISALSLNLPMELPAIVAGFFSVHELTSVLEHAAAAGLPLPEVLKRMLPPHGEQNGNHPPSD